MNRSSYTKLPGRGWSWIGPSRVWLGEHHVLLVLNRIFFESYRRFFLKDIQAIVVRQTHTGKIWSIIWGTPAAISFLLMSVLPEPIKFLMPWCAMPFVIILVINTLLGPTCALHIRTAVQTERLPAVSRLRSARRFISLMEPLITEAQGGIGSEQLAAELASLQAQATTQTAPAPPVLGS
jgi:hypothetical protein